MTFDEIASNLGVSKSTVSRAFNGMPGVGEETRKKIQEYAKANGIIWEKQVRSPKVDGAIYAAHTKKIGVVLPADVYTKVRVFFLDCLLGVCETASLRGYTIMITTFKPDIVSEIKKMVDEHAVDAFIVMQSIRDDVVLEYLHDINFPAALTGTCPYSNILQVDIDNMGASKTLTSILIQRGYKKFGIAIDNADIPVNQARFKGIKDGIEENGLRIEDQITFLGMLSDELIDSFIQKCMFSKVECIICGDDLISTRMMSRLQADSYRIPNDIAIASLYNSPNLNCFSPAITTVDASAQKVGKVITNQLINKIEGDPYQQYTLLDYGILVRKSTDVELFMKK